MNRMSTKESFKSLASPSVVSFPGRTDAQTSCPSCGARGLSLFYAVDGVPVHSCLLMPGAKVAVEYPKGDLLLGYCSKCGFICNTLFELANNEYSTRYEETQGFSPTFNKFARELARR